MFDANYLSFQQPSSTEERIAATKKDLLRFANQYCNSTNPEANIHNWNELQLAKNNLELLRRNG
jgi:O-glycosyl hydrolase